MTHRNQNIPTDTLGLALSLLLYAVPHVFYWFQSNEEERTIDSVWELTLNSC